MPPVTLGSILAVIVLAAAVVLGLDHQLGRDTAVLVGLLAIARLT